MLVLDLVVTSAVYLTVLNIYSAMHSDNSIDYLGHVGLLFVIILAISAGTYFIGKNDALEGISLRSQISRVILTMAIGLVITTTVIFLLKLEFVSRSIVIGFFLINTVILILIRAFILWWYFSSHKEKEEEYLSILLIGSGVRARTLAKNLETRFVWGVKVVGYLDPQGISAGRRKDDRILGHVDDISAVLRDIIVDEVIVAVPRKMLGDVQSIIDACQEEGVHLRFMADIYDFDAARIQLTMVENIPLLSFQPVAQNEAGLITKRIIDLLMVLAAMPFILPLLGLIAIAIRIDSPGPAIFCQERVGLHRRRFKLYKFRSMVANAESTMHELEHLNEADGPNFKIKNDPRVTRIGRFLRRSSIDEIPQLFNVILGDMSLVGPRPMAVRDVNLFNKGVQRKRFSVRPGITCLWQISGRSDLTFDEWLTLDLKYIDKWSLWLDFKILLLTIPTVLKGSGAV